ncbi:hypothetical protein Q604_UNBc4C00165G0001, partial [human gut metagenome]
MYDNLKSLGITNPEEWVGRIILNQKAIGQHRAAR